MQDGEQVKTIAPNGNPEVLDFSGSAVAPELSLKYRDKLWPWITGIVIALVGIAAITVYILVHKPSGVATSTTVVKNQQVNVGKASAIAGSFTASKQDTVIVNGQLQAANSIVVVPSAQPTNATLGQIYLDQTTKQLYYYNGTNFASLGNQITNVTNGNASVGVVSLQGQNGSITLLGTNGLSISAAGTNINLALPQDLTTSAAPTFSGLTLAGNLGLGTGNTIFANTFQQTGTGSGITINSGTDQLTINANGRSFILPTSGGASQTICTTGITCVAGGGQALLLAPGSAQSNASNSVADSSIFINNSGTADLVELQSSGSDTFVVDNTGALTLGKAGPSGTNGTITFKNSANSFATTLDAPNQTTGSATVSLPDTAGAADTICLLTIANCTGGSSGAPSNATYLTLSFNGSLSAERALIPGTSLAVTDNGANGNYNINTIQDIRTSASPQFAAVLTNTITPSGTLTVGATAQQFTLQGSGSSTITATNGINTTSLVFAAVGANKTITIPNETGTVCTTGSICAGYQSALTFNNGLTNASGTVQLGGSLLQNTTVATGNNFGLTLTSDLSGGARSTPGLVITQANDATNNNTSNLVRIENLDTGSGQANGDVLQVTNACTASCGAAINIAAASGSGIALAGSGTGITGFNANTIGSGTAFSATGITTGTGLSLSGLTTGKAINILQGNNNYSTAGALSVNGAATAITSGFTGSWISINPTRTLIGTSVTDSGNFLNLARSNTVNSAGQTFTNTGALASLSSNCTQTAGTCTDSSNILSLNQQYASASGTVLRIQNSGTGDFLQALDSGNNVLARIDASGNLTVKQGTFNGTLTVNGHIISGGTSQVNGNVTAGAAANCTSAASGVSISGNDTSGTVSFTTGAATCSAGTLVTLAFSSVYTGSGANLRVILTPANSFSSALQYYNGTVNTSSGNGTSFTIDSNSAATPATPYKYNYLVVQ